MRISRSRLRVQRFPAKFHGVIKAIRNKVGAHYDPTIIARALDRRASHPALWNSSITLGDDIADMEYKVAHQIEETITARLIFGIDSSLDEVAFGHEAAEFLGHGHELSESYAGFCQEFCGAALHKYGALY